MSVLGAVESTIEKKIRSNISVDILQIDNESESHAVPENSESHFKIVLISPVFDGLSLLARHRLMNELLRDELAGPIHALALHTYTPAEWLSKNKTSPQSVACLGGGIAN